MLASKLSGANCRTRSPRPVFNSEACAAAQLADAAMGEQCCLGLSCRSGRVDHICQLVRKNCHLRAFGGASAEFHIADFNPSSR